MPRKAKYPNEIYVQREQDSRKEEFLLAHETPDLAADIGSENEIAIYRLVRVTTVSAKAIVK